MIKREICLEFPERFNKKIKQFVPVRGYRLLFQVLEDMNCCAYLHMTSRDGNDVCQERSVSV